MVAARWVTLLLLSDAGGRRCGRERRDKGEEAGWRSCKRLRLSGLCARAADSSRGWTGQCQGIFNTVSLAFACSHHLTVVALLNSEEHIK
jgi:hypothetical protein